MAAGLGFKDFTTGEVLTAADVDGYLMQGVWVFASATARDAAVTSPQEGNFAYLKDTNVTTYYTGSAWANLDTTGMTNPMTTTGDTIYSSSGSTPARLGIGTAGQVLTVNSGATAPEWATPASGSTFAGCNLYITTNVSVANATWVKIPWDAENFDTNAYHSTSTNTTRITIPSGKGGYYQVNVSTQWSTFNEALVRIGLYKNNSLITQNSSTKTSSFRGFYTYSHIFSLAATDYLEIAVNHEGSGGSQDLKGNDFSELATMCSVGYLGA
jgi:hypothetical protein